MKGDKEIEDNKLKNAVTYVTDDNSVNDMGKEKHNLKKKCQYPLFKTQEKKVQ